MQSLKAKISETSLNRQIFVTEQILDFKIQNYRIKNYTTNEQNREIQRFRK